MNKSVIFFNKSITPVDEEVREKLGIRGRRAVDLANVGLPIVPGFIIDSELTKKLPEVNIKQIIKTNVGLIEKEMKKVYGDPSNPLLLKVVLSSDLNVPYFPSFHNIGLNDDTVKGFASQTSDEKFAFGEYAYMLRGLGTKLCDADGAIFSASKKDSGKFDAQNALKAIDADKKHIDCLLDGDIYDQLISILKRSSEKFCDSDIDVDNSMSIMVQAMVYGNLGENSYSGSYYTRDIINGDSAISGSFLQNEFDIFNKKPKEISKIGKEYYNRLQEIGNKIEEQFKEIRSIKFTIEEGNLWLIEQREVDENSTQSHLLMLLDLQKRDIIDKDYLVKHIQPAQLNELLHPIIDNSSVKTIKKIQGGISGSTGACIGRVFFSTEKLLEEHKRAIMHGKETNFILCMEATYAEDVKAIEVAKGVISTEGGYSSHAPVVARSLGKVAMVQPNMKIREKSFTIGNVTVNEGAYVSLNVPYYEEPTIFFGKAGLIEPDFEKNGLLELVNILQEYIDDFDVRANADQPREAKLSRNFQAQGIGLCRTEHMFFNEKRIMKFREMILAGSESDRRKVLKQLQPMQRSDFYELFKIMEGFPVTIRLLDAPLHEFLPRTDDSMKEFIKYMQTKNKSLKASEIQATCADLSEMNPMLGHRGCRVAITYPEIYEMQCRAIFEAVCMLKKEGIEAVPEIMIPVVMTETELKFVKNGKKIEGTTVKGIRDIRNEVLEEYGVDEIKYSVGSMIELPAAAFRAGKIAQYAEFFSFGTNDLTQTTYGLSRDDVNSFFPSYTLYDLVKNNPFQVLGDEVKEIIGVATQRGRLTRPNLKLGLCGEHGADPENIEFCKRIGLNYVSTSPYSIPLAKLAIAQLNLTEREEE
ncbi:MAG: pyruvate, phosphate dikinase [Spirochaetes bacterium]|nr:pyruvate, phosphate dikinase [Spirochaetota bacterium]MBN2771720.1 pyruvate, phosphate dikinase [Spirochaetota bacterium]